jgi:pimeloyl-ACP methyl ester carboxylesterase
VTSPRPVRDIAADAFNACLTIGVRRRELDRGGRKLRWLEAGAGDPPVVFESGAASNSVTWAAVFVALAPDHRVIAYDRAGYGASDPAPLSVDGQLADLIALLEAVAPDPAILVGHSWRGLLAQLVAWSRPELIAGLLLLDPSHERFWLDLTEPPDLRAIGGHPDLTQPAKADHCSADLTSYADQLSHEVAASVSDDPRIRDLFVQASRSYLATDEQLGIHLDEVPMIVDRLEDLTHHRSTATWPEVPTIILTATKGRPPRFVAPVIAIQEQVARAANAQHIVVPDSGHYIHVDRPDLVTRLVRDIAARLGG